MEQSIIQKQLYIMELLAKINDPIVLKFFDTDSDEMLNKKIIVLHDLAAGVAPADIPDYYEVLELYPKDNHWD